MADEITPRQRDCKNIWHQRPGALLKCPHCDMTIGQWKPPAGDQPDRMRAVPSAPPREQRGPPPDVRVEFRLFEGAPQHVSDVIREANEWCRKVAADSRTEIVNSEFKLTDTYVMLVIATRVILG